MKLGRVDLNLLVVLDALLREKNVTRAAESLHLSQPATSTALARLRRVLGDELLYKSGRHMELTPRAESLIDPVREVLATIEQSIVAPRAFDPTSDSRRFSMLSSDYVGVTLIRPLIIRLAGLTAGIRLDAAPVGSGYIEALQRDEVDIAVLPDRIVDQESLEHCSRMPVIVDRFVGLVWSGHPSSAERLTSDLLAAWPYLQYSAEGRRSLVEEDLDAAGCTRRVVATAGGFVTMPFMLTGTDLVAVVPERLARRVTRDADLRVLEPEMELRPLLQSAFWHSRRDQDPGHRWMRGQLAAVASQENPGLSDLAGSLPTPPDSFTP